MFGLMAFRPKIERPKPAKTHSDKTHSDNDDTDKAPPPRSSDDDDVYGAGDICAPEPDRDDEQQDL